MRKKQHSILLVNPWIVDFAAHDFWAQPLGLLKLATLFERLGCAVRLIDFCDRTHPVTRALIEKQGGRERADGTGNFAKVPLEKPAILSFVPRRYSRYGMQEELLESLLGGLAPPSLVCVTSGMTYWYPGVAQSIALIRKFWKDVPVVLGGIYASLLPEHAIAVTRANAVFSGDIDAAFLSYAIDLLGLDPDAAQRAKLLGGIHQPAWHHIGGRPAAVIETSRGCPFHCSYCASNVLTGPFHPFSPTAVIESIDTLAANGHRHIAFYDDALFSGDASPIKPLLRHVVQRKLQLSFHSPNGLFPRQIDRELADLMHASGFATIRLSLDTASAERQRAMGKVVTHEFLRAVGNLVDAGFSPSSLEVYLLAGLPEQHHDEIKRGIELVASCGCITRLAQYSPVPRTRTFELLCQQGFLSPTDDPLLHNPTVWVYRNPWLGFDDYRDLKLFADTCNNECRRRAAATGPDHEQERIS